MALANNLELLSAGFSVDQARENINVQKAGHYPTLGLNVSSAMYNPGELDTTLNMRDLGVSAFRKANIEKGNLGAFIEAIEKGMVKPGSYLLFHTQREKC